MTELIVINNHRITMSSREIAELSGKRHDNVMRDIRDMLAELANQGELSVLKIEETPYVNEQNGQVYTEFHLDKELTITLVAGYSTILRRRIVSRWMELESAPADPRELTRLELLQIAMDSEQKRLTAEAERDLAIATKAQIGNRREATAMATASAAIKQVKRLEGELGRNQKHATIIAVERATGKKLAKNAFVSLRQWCKANGHAAVNVVDARYGTVKAWPAAAWLAAYGIDLCELFATNGGDQ